MGKHANHARHFCFPNSCVHENHNLLTSRASQWSLLRNPRARAFFVDCWITITGFQFSAELDHGLKQFSVSMGVDSAKRWALHPETADFSDGHSVKGIKIWVHSSGAEPEEWRTPDTQSGRKVQFPTPQIFAGVRASLRGFLLDTFARLMSLKLNDLETCGQTYPKLWTLSCNVSGAFKAKILVLKNVKVMRILKIRLHIYVNLP